MPTNRGMDSSTPFATVRVGQPTLRHSVKLGMLEALEQRISVRCQVKGLTPDETAGYVRHRLGGRPRRRAALRGGAITQGAQQARRRARTVDGPLPSPH